MKLMLEGQFAGRQIAQRFKSEAIAAAVLQHPNIVAVHEVGVHEDRHFFSMDYVQGPNLTEVVAQRPLPAREAARYVKLIAGAIHYAHGQGILHRDLKPSNVLIDAATDQPRVTDFGLARRLDGESSLTVSGQVLGSPHFMPPEQAGRGRGKVGRASDVFGLGGILYFLLTARAPFQGETIEATIDQVLHAEPVAPRLLNTTVPPDVETICLKCLEKEPGRRYQTAEEVVEELGRFLRDEPILARPLSQVERAWRWCRRKPAVAAFATATLLLLLALVIGSAVAAWRIAAARDAERRQRQRAEQNADEMLKSQQHARRLLYASDINLAQQSLQLNNLGKALRLLERHRPQPGEEDLRGWEWRYLWQLTRSSALVTLTQRPTRGDAVSFSQDGRRLAVGWYDGHVDLWDVRELAFSQDGSRLVVYAGSDSQELGDQVWLMNVASLQTESAHPTCFSAGGRLSGAARLSPDNRRLDLARSDRLKEECSIRCVDLATGQELWETARERDAGLTALAISPDGRVLGSGSGFEDPTIRIWDADTGRRIFRFGGHTGWVSDLVFTSDGRHLISAAGDQSIRYWDTSTWTETKVLRGHVDEVHAIAIAESTRLLASVSKDGHLLLWQEDGQHATEGYTRLPEGLRRDDVLPLDRSRLLLLPRQYAALDPSPSRLLKEQPSSSRSWAVISAASLFGLDVG